jgi:hypothetical protein
LIDGTCWPRAPWRCLRLGPRLANPASGRDVAAHALRVRAACNRHRPGWQMPGVHHAACAACLAVSHGWGIYIDDGAPSTFALVQTSRRLSTCCALARLCSGAVAALTRLGFFSSSTPLAVTRPSRTPALARGRGCRCSSSVTSEALIGHSAQFAPCGAVAGPGRAPGLAQHR